MPTVARLLEALTIITAAGHRITFPVGHEFIIDPGECIGIMGDYFFDTRNARYITGT